MNVKSFIRTVLEILLVLLVVVGLIKLTRPTMSSRLSEEDLRHDRTVRVVEDVMPCVVNIATATVVEYQDFYSDFLRRFYGYDRAHPGKEIGSGVIVDEDGYILTNFHVLRRATRVQVKLWDGRIYDADPLVYTPFKDVALLKLRAKPGEKFKAIKFAADDDLLLGETVIALGNPYGLGGSVTRGILSSKNRRPYNSNEPLNEQDWLQTDADINPGNSGGPLINLNGELIGISVAVYRDQQSMGMGVGFAIPVKQIATAMGEFFSPEVTASLWFGARLKPSSLPLQIASIQPGSPADKAGLQVGQQILQVNGIAPGKLLDFNRLIAQSKDRNATLQLGQGSKTHTASVQMVSLADMMRQKIGFSLAALTPETAASFNVRVGEALLIQDVEKGSPADVAELQPGFLLTGIDNQSVGNVLAAALILSGKQTGTNVQFTVAVTNRTPSNALEFRKGTATVQVR